MNLKFDHTSDHLLISGNSTDFISVTGTSGTFYSINYPNHYYHNYEEQYTITVEAGLRISLVFEHFDIENHVSCLYDYIEGNL